MKKKLISFFVISAFAVSFCAGILTVSASAANSYFTFNTKTLTTEYDAASHLTLNSDTAYTYGNAKYSGLIDLSSQKWGTEKASVASLGMTTDWSGYDMLRVRYYSTIQDAYYSIFLSDTTSQSNRYRFTVYADKVGWQVADIDFNALKSSGSPSLSNINYIQIRTDNNTDSTGGSSAQVGSGATSGLKFYFDKIWLDNYEAAGSRTYISFVDNAATIANWTKADGTAGNGKLNTANGGFYGAQYSCYIDLNSQKWGSNQGSISNLGMITDWSDYDTLNLRFKSNQASKFFTIFLYCNDGYTIYYKTKITARKADWYTAEIPFSSFQTKNSPGLDSIKYIQIRTDENTDGGQACGSGATSGWRIFFDKLWLTKTAYTPASDFGYVYANGEAEITGVGTLSTASQTNMVIPSAIDGNSVTKISSSAFNGNKNIASVTIPGTVKEISSNAFYGCSNLRRINSDYDGEVILPNGLEILGYDVFRTANRIRTVILPDTITTLQNSFNRSSGVENIYFPASIPSSQYKPDFVAGYASFETIDAYGPSDSYIAIYADDANAIDNSSSDSNNKSGNKLYNYIEENGDILVYDYEFTDGDGLPLLGMKKDLSASPKDIGISARLVNVKTAESSFEAIICIYNSANALKGIGRKNMVIPARSGISITNEDLEIENVELADGDVIRVMFWENVSASMEPVVTQEIKLTIDASGEQYLVMAIGNSFAQDSMRRLKSIAAADGVNITSFNCYYGGRPLGDHYSAWINETKDYQLQPEGRLTTKKVTNKEVVGMYDWDYVMLQGTTHSNFYDEGLWTENATYWTTLKEGVSSIAPNAKRLVHATWAPYEALAAEMNNGQFADGSPDARAAYTRELLDKEQYGANIYSTVSQSGTENKAYIPTAVAIDRLIRYYNFPQYQGTVDSGGCYDNSITTRGIFRDTTCHLTSNVGQIVAGLVWYEMITGNSAVDNAYTRSTLSSEDMAKIKEAAHYACQNYATYASVIAE